ncbi:hypothetical protein ANANG_G00072670 [Anguilla anguilla]|uniref:Uncharacterized protein n=1 Tax=Anguilla anguilla TaxID=7936 RepID=A0A9D3S2V2_ANGAN|nr:hypothetical protein ANANG_G00072670 [Anguilla anguilla]
MGSSPRELKSALTFLAARKSSPWATCKENLSRSSMSSGQESTASSSPGGPEGAGERKEWALGHRKLSRSPWQQYSVITSTGPEQWR